MSRCFAVLRLEVRARGPKLESGSKSSWGLASEGQYPSNSTKQRLPRCIYLFFLPLNICSGSCVKVLIELLVSWTPSLFGAVIAVTSELQSLQLLALFWGAFARVKHIIMKCIQVESIAGFGIDIVNGSLKLPLLVWYFWMGGDLHQVAVLNTLTAALWPCIQKVGVHMILFHIWKFHMNFIINSKTCCLNMLGILTFINDDGNSMTSVLKPVFVDVAS